MCCLAWSVPAHALYEIVTSSGTYTTECYSIRAEKLVQCDGREIDLRAVQAVDNSRLTTAEIEQHGAAVDQFMERIKSLQAIESELRALETENQDVLTYIVDLKAAGNSAERLADAQADARRTLEKIERESGRQIELWRTLSVPDRELVPLRDVKILQYTARSLSCREWMLFLKTYDPTVLANAREHGRQADMFEESFRRHLEAIGSPREEEEKI